MPTYAEIQQARTDFLRTVGSVAMGAAVAAVTRGRMTAPLRQAVIGVTGFSVTGVNVAYDMGRSRMGTNMGNVDRANNVRSICEMRHFMSNPATMNRAAGALLRNSNPISMVVAAYGMRNTPEGEAVMAAAANLLSVPNLDDWPGAADL